MRPQINAEHPRVAASLPFVEQLARRVAATMPHSIDIGDLVQDGVIGLIDAAHRFDEARGIKFETFAERRIRGAMIDALRKDAWPRGVRRQRRELEAAREELRRELGCEPSLADLAAKVGSDEKRLGRTIVRINAIESTSPLANADKHDESSVPVALMPSEPERPDAAYERDQVKERVRGAIASLPAREQRVIAMYYYQEATMKQIGAAIGVNESRVSQLHARAIRRLREALGSSVPQAEAVQVMRTAILEFQQKPKGAKTSPESRGWAAAGAPATAGRAKRGVVVDITAAAADLPGYASVSRTARSKSASRNGLASQRQPVSSMNRSASVPATSPVTKMTRRASAGVAEAIAR
jgi:RNA polymerase sigma factor for flagellar operon FliA